MSRWPKNGWWDLYNLSSFCNIKKLDEILFNGWQSKNKAAPTLPGMRLSRRPAFNQSVRTGYASKSGDEIFAINWVSQMCWTAMLWLMKLSGSNIFWKNALAGRWRGVFLKPNAPKSVSLRLLGSTMFWIISHTDRCRADFAKLIAPKYFAPCYQLFLQPLFVLVTDQKCQSCGFSSLSGPAASSRGRLLWLWLWPERTLSMHPLSYFLFVIVIVFQQVESPIIHFWENSPKTDVSMTAVMIYFAISINHFSSSIFIAIQR